jgi:hypothetical protein
MNGFSNWETFNVSVWFANDETLYHEQQRFVRTKVVTAASVEAFVREVMPNGTPDMANAKELDGVDWDELANDWDEDNE